MLLRYDGGKNHLNIRIVDEHASGSGCVYSERSAQCWIHLVPETPHICLCFLLNCYRLPKWLIGLHEETVSRFSVLLGLVKRNEPLREHVPTIRTRTCVITGDHLSAVRHRHVDKNTQDTTHFVWILAGNIKTLCFNNKTAWSWESKRFEKHCFYLSTFPTAWSTILQLNAPLGFFCGCISFLFLEKEE